MQLEHHTSPEPLIRLKACTKCGRYQPDTLDHFYRVRGAAGTICLACNRARCAAYSEGHREQSRRRVRQWRASHPERAAQHQQTRDLRGKDARRRIREQAAGGSFTRAQVLARLVEQDGRCHWCDMPLDPSDTRRTTGDHLMPLARGGRTEPGNLIVSCLGCNARRGAKTEPEYRAYLLELTRDGAA